MAVLSAAVIALGLGSTAYWILSAPSDPVVASDPAVPLSPSPAATEASDDVAEHAAADGATGTADAAVDAASKPKACSTSRDCGVDETCFDGLCERDDD